MTPPSSLAALAGFLFFIFIFMAFSKIQFNNLAKTAKEIIKNPQEFTEKIAPELEKVGGRPLSETYGPAKAATPRSPWFRISRERWFLAWKELKPIQKSTLLSLWLYAGSRDYCWPSEGRLARDLGISRKAVWRTIKILEKKKFIKIEKSKGKFNKYFLLK